MVTQFGFPYSQGIAMKARIMWSFFPPNLFAQALHLLLTATSNPKGVAISWSKRADCPPSPDDYPPDNNDCVMTIVSTHFIAETLNIDSHQLSFPLFSFHYLHFCFHSQSRS